MFNDEEWDALSEELLKLSLQGKLNWEHWADGFSTVAGNSRFSVGSKDHDGRPPYFLAAYKIEFIEELDEDGLRLVGSVETVPPGIDTSVNQDHATDNILQLITLAERLAKGTPQLFKELLGNLKELEDSEPSPW